MVNGGESIGCPCTVCNAKGGTIPSLRAFSSLKTGSASGDLEPPTLKIRTSHKGRPKVIDPGMDVSRVDEEGTPDVYRHLIDKLRKQETVDEAITEPLSMDWRAEQEILSKRLQELRDRPQVLPRIGEIVLYVRELPEGVEICFDNRSREFKLRNREAGVYIGFPAWEAGILSQTPAEITGIADLVLESKKEMNVSYSGVRIEPLPSPNNPDKSISKRYKYVPLHHTRPFVFWKDFVRQIPEDEWHPTIRNALTVMASISLMGKYRFRGKWPEAQIYCHGLYLGSELLVVGDTIRLVPKTDGLCCTEVLTIKSIRLKLSNLDLASSNDYDEGRPYNSSVQIFGKAYTTDAGRSSKEWLSSENPLPEVLKKYTSRDTWHPLHPPTKEMQIPMTRVLGRLFESEAMTLWHPALAPSPANGTSARTLLPPDLSKGLVGLQEARAFARANDERIVRSFGSTWYWGDTRAEALDLHTVNGLELSKFDNGRDPREWRRGRW